MMRTIDPRSALAAILMVTTLLGAAEASAQDSGAEGDELAPEAAVADEAVAPVEVPPPPEAGAQASEPPPPPPADRWGGLPPPAGPPLENPAAFEPPPGQESLTRERANWLFIGLGAGLLAGGWLATWIGVSIWYGETTSCTSTGWFGYTCTHFGPDDTVLGVSFIPLVGPWLMLGSDSLRGGDFAVPILAGVGQLTGLILFIYGLAVPEQVSARPRASAPSVDFAFAPTPGGAYGQLTVRAF